MSASDSDDWGADFAESEPVVAVPLKGVLQPPPAPLDNDLDEDWEASFEAPQADAPTLVLRGVKSSAVEREDWADDFDFAPQEKSKLKHKLRMPPAARDTPSRRRPTSGVSSALHNSGGGGSGKKKQLVFSSSPSTSSVFTQMPNVVAPALRLLPMLPVDSGDSMPPCSGSHAHLDRAAELRAWSVERRQKALRAEHKHADELKASAKPDARSLCVSLVTQGLLLMADDHIAKAVKCFDHAYSVFLTGGSATTADHVLHCTILYELGHASLALSDVFRARASLGQVLDVAANAARSTPRGVLAPVAPASEAASVALASGDVTCIAAQTQLLLGQHASLSDEPASSAALLSAALRHVCGGADENGCAALAQCAHSRWLVVATVALAMGKAALRGFDLDAAGVGISYAAAVARRLGDTALLAEADAAMALVKSAVGETTLRDDASFVSADDAATASAESSDWDAELTTTSSEGNWDETLGVEQRATPLRLATVAADTQAAATPQQTNAANDADNMSHDAVGMCRILKSEPHVDIVRLPKPPALLTMRTPQRLHVFHEAEFESWLSHIIELHHADNSALVAGQSTKRPSPNAPMSDELKAINVDLVGLLEIERGSQQRAQLEWALRATTQMHETPALADQLCLLRRLAFVMATQLQTRQAWNLIGQFFALLGTSAADASGEAVRNVCEQYALDVLMLGAKLQRPTAPDSAAQFKLWCGALRRFAPWRAIDLALLQLEADVHHGAIDFESAHRRLLQLLRRVHESPDGTRRAGSFGPTTSSRRRSQKLRSVMIPTAIASAAIASPAASGSSGGGAASGGAAGASTSVSTPALALAIDSAAEEHRHKLRVMTFARILLLSYCLRTELSPLSFERMRDVLRNSDNESSDGSGDAREQEPSPTPHDSGSGNEATGNPSASIRRRRRRSMRFEASDVSDDDKSSTARKSSSRAVAAADPSSGNNNNNGTSGIKTRSHSRSRQSGGEEGASRKTSRRRRRAGTGDSGGEPASDSDDEHSGAAFFDDSDDGGTGAHGAAMTPPQSARTRTTTKSPMVPRSRALTVDENALVNDDRRHELLREYYVHLPGCYLKAAAAYALGSYESVHGSLPIGRSLLVESVLTLDQMAEVAPGVHPLLSNLGSIALMKLGDLLLQTAARPANVDAGGQFDVSDTDSVASHASNANLGGGGGGSTASSGTGAGGVAAAAALDWFGPGVLGDAKRAAASAAYAAMPCDEQYVYAIVALEAAVDLYRTRQRDVRAVSLLKRMAVVAREHDDMDRAVRFYSSLLSSYCAAGKMHEAVYVAETLATLHLDSGNFRMARGYLEGAAGLLSDRALQYGARRDPKVVQLRLRLARVCLKSYHFEAGIEALEALRAESSGMSAAVRSQVDVALVLAYSKKGWYGEARALLAPLLDDARKRAAKRGVDELPLARLQALLASNYMRAGLLAKALAAIDVALAVSPPHDLAAIARYLYVRGKVLQAMCSEAASMDFPSALLDEALFADMLAQAPQTRGQTSARVHFFSCGTDVLQEAVETLRRAYRYFKLVNDDVRIAKTVSRIAAIYLERVFPPVAFLEQTYDDMARFKRFAPSRTGALQSTSAPPPPMPTTTLIARAVDVLAAEANMSESDGADDAEHETPSTSARYREDASNDSSVSSSAHVSGGGRRGSDEHADAEFFIEAAMIENPARLGLELASSLVHVTLTLTGYLNMAELCYVRDDLAAAVGFWAECRDLLLAVFFDGGARTTPTQFPLKMLRRLGAIVVRAVRFLFALGQDTINKNLALIDCHLNLQAELLATQRRGVLTPDSDATTDDNCSHPTSPASASSNAPSAHSGGAPSRMPPAPAENAVAEQQSELIGLDELLTGLVRDDDLMHYRPRTSGLSGAASAAVAAARSPRQLRATPLDTARFRPYRSLTAVPGDTSFGGSGSASSTMRSMAAMAAAAALTREQAGNLALGVPASAELTSEYTWGGLFAIKTTMRRFSRGELSRSATEAQNAVVFSHVVKAITARARFLAQRARARDLSPSASLLHMAMPPSGRRQTMSDSDGDHSVDSEVSSRHAAAAAAAAAAARSARAGTRVHLRERVRRMLQRYSYRDMPTQWFLDRAALARIVYILQLGDYFVCYAPETGARRVQRLGGTAHDLQLLAARLPAGAPLRVRVHLVSAADQYMDVVTPADTSLRDLLSYCCVASQTDAPRAALRRQPSDSDTGGGSRLRHRKRKGSEANSAAGAANASDEEPEGSMVYVSQTDQFRSKLSQLLRYVGDVDDDDRLRRESSSPSASGTPGATPTRLRASSSPGVAASTTPAEKPRTLQSSLRRIFSTKASRAAHDRPASASLATSSASTGSAPAVAVSTPLSKSTPVPRPSAAALSGASFPVEALEALRFATRTQSGTYLSVAGDHATVPLSSCFSKAALMSACDAPGRMVARAVGAEQQRLQLYVYVSSSNPSALSATADAAARSRPQMTLTLDATVKAFLQTLLVATAPSEIPANLSGSSDVANFGGDDKPTRSAGVFDDALRRNPFMELTRRAVRTMAHATFAALFDVLPSDQQAAALDGAMARLNSDDASSGNGGGSGSGSTGAASGASAAASTASSTASLVESATRRGGFLSLLQSENRAEQLQFAQRAPLLFVASRHVNAFPWQLITQRSVRQFFTLRDVAGAHRHIASAQYSGRPGPPRQTLSPVPHFVAFVDNPVLARSTTERDEKRRKDAYVETLRSLNATSLQPEGARVEPFLGPMHAPVVQRGKKASAFRKKFRTLTLIDSSHLSDAVLRARGIRTSTDESQREPMRRSRLAGSSALLAALSSGGNAATSSAASNALAAAANEAAMARGVHRNSARSPFALLTAAIRAISSDADHTLTCLLLTFADLLEFNDLLVDIAREHQRLVMLFVPAAHLKVVGRRIDDVTEDYAKLCHGETAGGREGNAHRSPHAFLSALIGSLSAAGVPLAVFNLDR